jgi:hypothetical protein
MTCCIFSLWAQPRRSHIVEVWLSDLFDGLYAVVLSSIDKHPALLLAPRLSLHQGFSANLPPPYTREEKSEVRTGLFLKY